jgi:hypothetical protein
LKNIEKEDGYMSKLDKVKAVLEHPATGLIVRSTLGTVFAIKSFNQFRHGHWIRGGLLAVGAVSNLASAYKNLVELRNK